ncbi:MAG: hypothetical protein AABY78_01510 [Nitrospirota bacterium]
MGKATTRRKERRRKFLARLAQEDPERFEREWAKRIESWINVIWFFAKDGSIQTPPTFKIVDRAKETLTECGEKAMELEYKETKDVLENECCQALSSHIGKEIFRINQRWKPKE